jgi:hypothetical protein
MPSKFFGIYSMPENKEIRSLCYRLLMQMNRRVCRTKSILEKLSLIWKKPLSVTEEGIGQIIRKM